MRNPQKVKENIHFLIDKLNNNDLLDIVYQLLESKTSEQEGQMLKKLTVEEQAELYKSYDESMDEQNLVDLDQVKRDHSKWQEE